MSTEPEQIRAEIAALLAELPDIAVDGAGLAKWTLTKSLRASTRA